MWTLRRIGCIALAIAALAAQGGGQANAETNQTAFATNEYWAKGVLGIIRENLYIDFKSSNNALLFGDGHRWTGRIAPKPEVVIFFDNTVWSLQARPDRFDLSRAVVISFEGSKVRFFDFHKVSGGYYRRREPR
jgi:hypothetical protein